MYLLVRLTFWPFRLFYNQNRSALLCQLVSDNSLLAVNSMNYFTSPPQAGVHLRNAVDHLHLTDMPFILHQLLFSCMRLGLLVSAFKQLLGYLYHLASQLLQLVHFQDLSLHDLFEAI